MPEPLLRIAAALLGATFAWAALAKAARWSRWRDALRAYDLPRAMAAPAAPGVPLLEAGAAALLFAGATQAGAAVTVVLISGFSAALLHAHARQGDRLPCGCFGRATERDYRVMLSRNAFLGALAAVLLLASRDVSVVRALSAPSGDDILPAGLVVAGIGLCVWMAVHLSSLFGRKRSP